MSERTVDRKWFSVSYFIERRGASKNKEEIKITTMREWNRQNADRLVLNFLDSKCGSLRRKRSSLRPLRDYRNPS
jgi:hypothetical protein